MAKNEVQFIDTSKEVKQVLQGLSKTALRAGGKVAMKAFRGKIPVRSKRIKNHVGTWVFINKSTGQPELQIGYASRQRVINKYHKKASSASPNWVERGVKPHIIKVKNKKMMAYNDVKYMRIVHHPGFKGTNVLKNSVYENIDAIRKAQEEYLKQLNEELAKAGAKVENWEEIEDHGE